MHGGGGGGGRGREAGGAAVVVVVAEEGGGRCEIEGLLDVFEEATVAVGAGDGVGDPDEAAAAVTPVRSGRCHGWNQNRGEGKNIWGEREF